jgi:hypothetical protein
MRGRQTRIHLVQCVSTTLKMPFWMIPVSMQFPSCEWMVYSIILVTDTTDTDKLPPGGVASHNSSVANWSVAPTGSLSRR